MESLFHIGCTFSKCTGVETVKQSLNSIETNQELFHRPKLASGKNWTLISCAEQYAKHENKVWKKIILQKIFEWGHNLRVCPSLNIICQVLKNMHRYGPQTEFPDFDITKQKLQKFPHFQQNSMTFPWLEERLWQHWMLLCGQGKVYGGTNAGNDNTPLT